MSLLAFVSKSLVRATRFWLGTFQTANGVGKVFWVSVPVVFLCIACSAVGSLLSALTDGGAAPAEARSTSLLPNQPGAPTTVVASAVATATPMQTPTPTAIPTATPVPNDLGKTVQTDDWSLTIDDVQRVNALPWNDETIHPEGTWLVLIGTVTNLKPEDSRISSGNFNLRVPGLEQTIGLDRDATGAAGLTMNVTSTVSGFAGLPIDGRQTLPFVIAFDVPADTDLAVLVIDEANTQLRLGATDIEAIAALPTVVPTAVPTATPQPTATPTQTPIPVQRIEALVVDVVNGDTLLVMIEGRQQSVRLIGIDAPETPNDCYSLEAIQALRGLVDGKAVVLENEVSTIDSQGRLLRYVFVTTDQGNELHVNWELVWNGFANATDSAPDLKHQAEYRAAEAAARDAGRGLWDVATCNGSRVPPTPVPPTPVPPTALPAAEPAQPTGPANVVISYVMFDGEEYRSEGDEYAVIANKGGTAINLRGWLLNAGDRGQNFVFPSFVLEPGAAVRVYTNRNIAGTFTFARGSAIWANEGDCGSLYNAAGTVISEYCY